MPNKSIIMIQPRWSSGRLFLLKLSQSYTFGICNKSWKY